jgi:hypothetical protein
MEKEPCFLSLLTAGSVGTALPEQFTFTFVLRLSDRGDWRNLSIAPSIIKLFKLSERRGDPGLVICAFMTAFGRPVATWAADLQGVHY